jgi:light-regulated signal transduction histidine kinase (bacteriophytochrome)
MATTAHTQLHHRQEVLEELAHAVSHDLAQPLTTIAGFARILISRYDLEIDEKGHEYLAHIVKGAGDMQELIDEVVAELRAVVQEQAKASRPEASRHPVAA